MNTTFDRKQRLHQLEFEALPIVWDSLCDVDTLCRRFLVPFREYADVKSVGDAGVAEILLKKGAIQSEIDMVLQSADKQKSFIWALEKYNYNALVNSFHNFRHKMQKSSLYIGDDMMKLLLEYNNLVNSASQEQCINLLDGVGKWSRESIKQFQSRADDLVEEIKHGVIDHLYSNAR